MSLNQNVQVLSKKILEKYDLCDYCLGRLFTKTLNLKSNKLLGKKLNSNKKNRCYICKNIFDNLDYFIKLMSNDSSKYEYSSFSIGIILKPSIIERDDIIRSKFKLQGIDGIKTSITQEITKNFSKKMKKILDNRDPDIVFTLNFKDDSLEIRTKPIYLYGRYLKNERKLQQKQKSCDNCSGKGCRTCFFHGIAEFNSIEGIVSKFVFLKIGGTVTKFSWVGSEDKTSLVSGSGRPFFIKLFNPNKRSMKKTSFKDNSVEIICLKTIPTLPPLPVEFSSTLECRISSKQSINKNSLKKLLTISTNPVIVYEKSGKRYEKQITLFDYKLLNSHEFTIFLKFDGGLPVKRFVQGDDVSPSISSILNSKCTSVEFDFLDVVIK
ncbi:MAG: tRNA pseudouridine(54/55) synthase Pus10 [Nitrosopumilus sp.]